MKRFLNFLIGLVMILSLGILVPVQAAVPKHTVLKPYYSTLDVSTRVYLIYEGDYIIKDLSLDIHEIGRDEQITEYAEENECVMAFTIAANAGTVMEAADIGLDSAAFHSGGRAPYFGKDYRLYFYEDGTFTDVQITSESKNNVEFTAEKEGTYVIYYDPAVYDVFFYTDCGIYDEETEEQIEPPTLYYKQDNMLPHDEVIFPEIPKKEGYVFTGWKTWMESEMYYVGPQPITASQFVNYYAEWCPEDGYVPLKIEISSGNIIRKGEEDGKEIYVTISAGKFINDEDICDWNDEYACESWYVIGSDEVSVGTVERVDDKTVKLTLSGNSGSKTGSTYIMIGFYYDLLEGNAARIDSGGAIADTIYKSDNELVFKGKSRYNNSRVSSEPVKYTVKFETGGGSKIESRSVEAGGKIGAVAAPSKEGCKFDGWFTDVGLKLAYDENMTVNKSMTLYAKWTKEEEKSNNSFSRIVMTLGSRAITVFGEAIINDVAPLVKNDRVMLPSRFIAEALGAYVDWDGSLNKVTVLKDDITIEIFIGSDKAYVNGSEYILDSPAFAENNRTYTPLRFISEQLGAEATWNEETNDVIITYKK